MTLDREIPAVRASGSYYEVGRQIGEACSGAVGRAADLERAGVPRFGRSLDELLGQAALCRRMTAETYPFVLEELDGAAAGAGVPAEALFAASIEELWESRPSQNGRTEGRCTDVVVAPGATANGHLLVAHNNDLPVASEDDVVAIERDVPGDPLVFSIGIGPFISVGWNSAGLSLTGNEVSPNDERAGIPRLLLVRAQLRARTLEEAVAAGVHPLRASAYNSVLAHSSGAAVNVEASATAYGRWGPSERGTIVHTNHYVSPEMVAYEGDLPYALRSSRRFNRAQQLLEDPRARPADEESLIRILSDHLNGDDAICRHTGAADGVKTVFWCLADVTDRHVLFGRGNPCRSRPQSYRFDSAA